MSDSKPESSSDENNLPSWILTLSKLLNKPFFVNHYPAFLTNLLIIVAFFSGGQDLANLIHPPSEEQTEEYQEVIDNKQLVHEHSINMDTACNTESIQVKAREHLDIPDNANIIATAKLSSSEELWPVFRWKCNFKIKLNNEPGDFLKTQEVSLGIDLHKYCKSRYNNAWYASHKKHTDPKSLYCTLVHYEENDEQS